MNAGGEGGRNFAVHADLNAAVRQEPVQVEHESAHLDRTGRVAVPERACVDLGAFRQRPVARRVEAVTGDGATRIRRSTAPVLPPIQPLDGFVARSKIKRFPAAASSVSPGQDVIRRIIDPATVDAHMGPNPATPDKALLLDYAKTVLQPHIRMINQMLDSMTAGAGAAEKATVALSLKTLQDRLADNVYNPATARQAADTLILGLNNAEAVAENQLFVAAGANLNTAAGAKTYRQAHRTEQADILERAELIPTQPNTKLGRQIADAKLRRTEVEAATRPNNYDPVKAKTAMMAYESSLRLLEPLIKEGAVEEGIRTTMKIGTEFTFTHQKIALLNPEHPNRDINAWNAAMAFIASWKQKVKTKKIVVGDIEVQLAVTDDDITDGGLNGEKAPRFTYTWNGGSWWWRLNVDPGCLETQSDPIPAKRAELDYEGTDSDRVINTIIRNHIFGIAEVLEGEEVIDEVRTMKSIAPHETTGGGHLTLDATTTFSGNARFFRNMLVLYANDPNKWKAYDADAFNAPMISELIGNASTVFKTVIADFDRALRTDAPWSIAKLAEELGGRVFTYANLAKGDNVDQEEARSKQPKHYQAMNVEHMGKAGDDQRLEMRRFDAQKSPEDFLDDVAALVDLVAASRQPGTVPVAF
jgi:hypothetical protein